MNASDTERTEVLRMKGSLAHMTAPDWAPNYSPWRHGGWYVDTVRHPSGAVGCVSRNFEDRKWRVVCFDDGRTFRNRDEAAFAERDIAVAAIRAELAAVES